MSDVGQLHVDAVAALRGGQQFTLGLRPDPIGSGDCLGHDLLGRDLGLGGQPAGPAHPFAGRLLGFCTKLGDLLLGCGQLLLGQRRPLLEDFLGLVAATGEGLLEVGRGLGGLRALVFVERLGFRTPRGGLPVCVVQQLIGCPLGFLDDPAGFPLRAGARLAGVSLRVGPKLDGGRFDLAQLVRYLGGGGGANLRRFLLGENQDLAHPVTQVGERGFGRR